MKALTPGTKVRHDRYGEGYINKSSVAGFEIFFERGGKIQISRSADLEVVTATQESQPLQGGVDVDSLKSLISLILDEHGLLPANIRLAEKWKGGTMLLQPPSKELKPKEIPLETFFHKIVMVRDRLRVLEQNINSHPKLSEEDKIEIQQYITRIYGSLTTFNLLFDDKTDYFVGAKSDSN